MPQLNALSATLATGAALIAALINSGCARSQPMPSPSKARTLPTAAIAAPTVSSAARRPMTPQSPESSAPAPKAPAPSFGAPYYHTSVPTTERVVALTFDDGPHPVLTPKLLDILSKHGVKATFYVIGRNVASYPAVAARIVAEGHEIANHSWSHPNLAQLSDRAVIEQIVKTNEAIKAATGVEAKTFRPPYGSFSQRQRVLVYEQLGMPSIFWSVDPLDWKIRSSPSVHAKLVGGAHPGGILLAHDIHPTTVAAMPETLSDLSSKGYRFVTVTQLLAMASDFAAESPLAPPIAAAADDAR